MSILFKIVHWEPYRNENMPMGKYQAEGYQQKNRVRTALPSPESLGSTSFLQKTLRNLQGKATNAIYEISNLLASNY